MSPLPEYLELDKMPADVRKLAIRVNELILYLRDGQIDQARPRDEYRHLKAELERVKGQRERVFKVAAQALLARDREDAPWVCHWKTTPSVSIEEHQLIKDRLKEAETLLNASTELFKKIEAFSWAAREQNDQ